MRKLLCSRCKSPAVWLILDAPFCEAHKEEVIEKWGIDRFPIKRVEADEDLFTVRGRYKRGLQTALRNQHNLHNR